MNQDERVINLKDILAECLFQWKLILLAAIIGCVAGLGITVYKTRQYQSALAAQQAERAAQEAALQESADAAVSQEAEEQQESVVHNGSYDEQMEEARALLTRLQITKVDGLYAQYAANIQLRDSLADNINNSVIMKMDADNAAVTRLMYTMNSDQDYIANNLDSLVVTDELLEQAAQVLGEDVSPKYLQDLFSVWKGSTGSTGDSIHIYEDDRTTSLIYLQAIAYTQEQADQIAELMAERLEDAIRQMRELDPDIRIKRVSDVSTAVTSATVDDTQRTLVTELNNVANQIATIEVNEIPKLDENEKTYYDLLVSEGRGIHIDEPESTESTETASTIVTSGTEQLTPPSRAKYVALGLIGAPVCVVVCLFLYLFLLSRKARSLTEIESGTGIPTLAVFERRLGKVKDPIVRAGINLQTGSKAVEDEEAYRPILQVRIRELMTQNGRSALYLYEDAQSGQQGQRRGDAVASGNAVCGNMADGNASHSNAAAGETMLGGWSDFARDAEGISMISGQPESSPAAMQEFLQADSVILVTRMYRTEIAAITNAVDLCKVHGKEILGNIVIYEM